MRLPHSIVLGILESFNYWPTSFRYLREENPDLYEQIQYFYEGYEGYEMLETMNDYEEWLDKNFTLIMRIKSPPILLQKNEYHEEDEIKAIVDKGIPWQEFENALIDNYGQP